MIKITDENKDNIIASCLIEAANALSEAEKIKEQIDFLKSEGSTRGQINELEKRYNKLKDDERFQKYVDDHEDDILPQPKRSKNGKTLYKYEASSVDTDSGKEYLSKDVSTHTYAKNGTDARNIFLNRFAQDVGNKHISIDAQKIRVVYDNE